jgi:hypothetical protein
VIIGNRHPDLARRIRYLADPRFEANLQVSDPRDDEPLTQENGLIVGIEYSVREPPVFDKDKLEEGGARADAILIDRENELFFIFETKLSDTLYQKQIQRYFKLFFDPKRAQLEKTFVKITWNDIAAFLERLARLTSSSKEKYLISEFVGYIDYLGLVEFRGFTSTDFKEDKQDRLHKFLVLLTRELGDELGLDEYAGNNRLSFKDVAPDNIYVRTDGEGLKYRIVCGAGKKGRAQRLRDYLSGAREEFRSVLAKLRAPIDSEASLSLHINSYFRLSRFRTARLDDIGGACRFPEDYDRFVDTFISPETNAFNHVNKKQINRTFRKAIEAKKPDLDSKGLFPKWEDADTFLQYAYFDIQVSAPVNRVVDKSPDALRDDSRSLLKSMHATMVAIRDV